MKRIIFISLAAGAILFAGCAKLTLEGSGTPEPVCPSETAWQTYYGFDWSTPPVKKAKNGRGLYQVTVYSDYLCSLISVLSLGLAVPQRVEWQVQRSEPKDEKAEPMKPTTRLKSTKAR